MWGIISLWECSDFSLMGLYYRIFPMHTHEYVVYHLDVLKQCREILEQTSRSVLFGIAVIDRLSVLFTSWMESRLALLAWNSSDDSLSGRGPTIVWCRDTTMIFLHCKTCVISGSQRFN